MEQFIKRQRTENVSSGLTKKLPDVLMLAILDFLFVDEFQSFATTFQQAKNAVQNWILKRHEMSFLKLYWLTDQHKQSFVHRCLFQKRNSIRICFIQSPWLPPKKNCSFRALQQLVEHNAHKFQGFLHRVYQDVNKTETQFFPLVADVKQTKPSHGWQTTHRVIHLPQMIWNSLTNCQQLRWIPAGFNASSIDFKSFISCPLEQIKIGLDVIIRLAPLKFPPTLRVLTVTQGSRDLLHLRGDLNGILSSVLVPSLQELNLDLSGAVEVDLMQCAISLPQLERLTLITKTMGFVEEEKNDPKAIPFACPKLQALRLFHCSEQIHTSLLRTIENIQTLTEFQSLPTYRKLGAVPSELAKCSRLQTLVFGEQAIDMTTHEWSNILQSCQHIKNLQCAFKDNEPWEMYISWFLTRLPRLERLTVGAFKQIYYQDVLERREEFERQQTTQCPSLRHLALQMFHQDLLQGVSMPALETLQLLIPSENFLVPSSSPNLSGFARFLKTLPPHNLVLGDFGIDLMVETAAQQLVNFPHVRKLHISEPISGSSKSGRRAFYDLLLRACTNVSVVTGFELQSPATTRINLGSLIHFQNCHTIRFSSRKHYTVTQIANMTTILSQNMPKVGTFEISVLPTKKFARSVNPNEPEIQNLIQLMSARGSTIDYPQKGTLRFRPI